MACRQIRSTRPVSDAARAGQGRSVCARTASLAKCRTDSKPIVCRVRLASTILTMVKSYACLVSARVYTFRAFQAPRAFPVAMEQYLLSRCGTQQKHQKAARSATQDGLVCLVYVPRARVVTETRWITPNVTGVHLEPFLLKALSAVRVDQEHAQIQNKLLATFARKGATALMDSSASTVGHCLCHARTELGASVLLAPKTSGKSL